MFLKKKSRSQSDVRIKLMPDHKYSNLHLNSAIKFIRLPESKRSQTQVIATVLLIMIVIVTTVILVNFSVPFVKKQLAGTGCFDTVGKVSISDNIKYTCYDINAKEMRVQVRIGDSEEINGFLIELGRASSKSIQIKDQIILQNVRMYDSIYNTSLELPKKNEERTYVIKSEVVESVKIYPILKDGNSCQSSDSLEKVNVCK